MNSIGSIKTRLVLSFIVVAVLNISVISFMIYSRAHSTLIDRAQKHMISVRSLLHQKLNIILSHKENEGSLNWNKYHQIFDNVLAQREGLGETGEIYLVGDDYKIRSASRFIENAVGMNVKNEAVERGLRGESGTTIVQDYRNIEVISAYMPFTYQGQKFVLLSEIDFQEVISPLREVIFKVLQAFAGLVILNLVMIALSARMVVKKIVSLAKEIDLLNDLKEREVSRAAIRVIKAQEDEREKLSYNLHDSAGQYLTVLKWKLSSLEESDPRFKELNSLCDTIINEIRSVSQDLMPALIKDFGCVHAIRDYLEKQRQFLSFKINYELEPSIETLNLGQAFEVNLLRIIQELIQNTFKHARASTASLSMTRTLEELILVYTDDGIGFSSDEWPRSVAYRVNLFNGKLIKSSPEKGMEIVIIFNLKRDFT